MNYPYKWTLKDTVFTKDKGKVFSCFSCGGGSTMGYKLSGFDVIGCNEIDPKMMKCYIENHHPKYSFLEDIKTFKVREDLPDELFHLDILDGSPPCSSFSMAGNREKDWGKEKKFREGQKNQVLDTLFFDFIDLAKRLQPKVVIAENVKGIILGNAIDYVREIYKQFHDAGYYCQHFLLNASVMGVPQRRERVFFICLRRDLAEQFAYQIDMFTVMPRIKIQFNEKEILFKEIKQLDTTDKRKEPSEAIKRLWNNRMFGEGDMSTTSGRIDNRPNSFYSWNYIYNHNVANTITGDDKNILYEECRYFTNTEIKLIGTFPQDYNFKECKTDYLVGMSVPPVMIARIADEVYNQWLSKINSK